jgi:hypothetical protein
LINTDYFDGTSTRTSQNFTLSGLTGTTVLTTRLTATSALSRQDEGDAPTLGGQSFLDDTCQLGGDMVQETVDVVNGIATFSVAASEALLIDLLHVQIYL